MNPQRRRNLLALLALIPALAAVFWLTAVATSALPGSAAFAINVHGLTLNQPTSTLRPAPLSLSVLADAQSDAQTLTTKPSSATAPTVQATAPVRKPTPVPTPVSTPIVTPVATPSASPSVLPLPSPSIPLPTPSATPALGTIAGQVVDSQTKSPIARATISMTPPAAVGLTDSNGNYALMVGAGTYTVTATAAGYNSASQVVSVKSGQRVALSFRLTSSTAVGSIAGSVTDASSGSAIAAAVVTLSNGLRTVTDLNGNYSFPAVLYGSYTITASATGYVSQTVTITVKPGHQTTQDFQLAP